MRSTVVSLLSGFFHMQVDTRIMSRRPYSLGHVWNYTVTTVSAWHPDQPDTNSLQHRFVKVDGEDAIPRHEWHSSFKKFNPSPPDWASNVEVRGKHGATGEYESWLLISR